MYQIRPRYHSRPVVVDVHDVVVVIPSLLLLLLHKLTELEVLLPASLSNERRPLALLNDPLREF